MNNWPMPNLMNFLSITKFIQNCTQSRNLEGIKKFHAHLLRTNLIFIAPNLQTRVILTYATILNTKISTQKLHNLLKFIDPRNPLPFNSIISSFSQNGCNSLALKTFSFMHFNGVSMDSYALCSSLTSSSGDKNLIFGGLLHGLVLKSGWLSSVFVGSALIDLYAKLSSSPGNAAKVFEEMPVKNTVCANALLSGFADAKMWAQGIELVQRMPGLELPCDHFTFAAALRFCVGLSAIDLGKQIHGNAVRNVCDLGGDVFLLSLLIELYGKCGLVQKAEQIFNLAGFKRDVVLWTTLLGVYGKHGIHESVVDLFGNMLNHGIRPDAVAFLAVISACGHTGKIDLANEYFVSMARDFGLKQGPEHCSCLVDSLCRAGELDKAWKLLDEMTAKIVPCEASKVSWSVTVWGTLLSACNECGNVELGKLAGGRALQIEPHNTGIYVLLSNMFASHGLWDEIEQLRESMKARKLMKDIGCSWVDVTR